VDGDALLARLGLADKRNAWFMNLSGGQKQRLFIALALIHDPDVVLLDELTTGLDPQARRAIWDMVRGIRERGKTVLLTTHLMEEAEKLCDRVAIIERGRVVDAGTPEEVEQAFRTMAARRAVALIVTADAYLYAQRQRIAALALANRLPAVFPFAAYVDAGGLMSYGVDPAPAIRMTAIFVDKIFKGANPGDLPIEQPTRVEMVINRRTAAILRLTIPAALLLQAERVID